MRFNEMGDAAATVAAPQALSTPPELASKAFAFAPMEAVGLGHGPSRGTGSNGRNGEQDGRKGRTSDHVGLHVLRQDSSTAAPTDQKKGTTAVAATSAAQRRRRSGSSSSSASAAASERGNWSDRRAADRRDDTDRLDDAYSSRHDGQSSSRHRQHPKRHGRRTIHMSQSPQQQDEDTGRMANRMADSSADEEMSLPPLRSIVKLERSAALSRPDHTTSSATSTQPTSASSDRTAALTSVKDGRTGPPPQSFPHPLSVSSAFVSPSHRPSAPASLARHTPSPPTASTMSAPGRVNSAPHTVALDADELSYLANIGDAAYALVDLIRRINHRGRVPTSSEWEEAAEAAHTATRFVDKLGGRWARNLSTRPRSNTLQDPVHEHHRAMMHAAYPPPLPLPGPPIVQGQDPAGWRSSSLPQQKQQQHHPLPELRSPGRYGGSGAAMASVAPRGLMPPFADYHPGGPLRGPVGMTASTSTPHFGGRSMAHTVDGPSYGRANVEHRHYDEAVERPAHIRAASWQSPPHQQRGSGFFQPRGFEDDRDGYRGPHFNGGASSHYGAAADGSSRYPTVTPDGLPSFPRPPPSQQHYPGGGSSSGSYPPGRYSSGGGHPSGSQHGYRASSEGGGGLQYDTDSSTGGGGGGRSGTATGGGGGEGDDGSSLRPTKYRKRSRAPAPGECLSCSARETPEWRRGPSGARTLCNACGLQYSKLLRRRRNDERDETADVTMDELRASLKLGPM